MRATVTVVRRFTLAVGDLFRDGRVVLRGRTGLRHPERLLALISDAGHLAADVVALGAALVATKIATRPDATGRRIYGSYRAEVFASGLSVLLIIGVAVYVVVEALGRSGEVIEVQMGPMIVVGAVGLVINIVSIFLLRAGAQESLNVRGAYLEVVADAAGSVGVVVAGLLVLLTGNGLWDSIVALAIGLFVAVRAVGLGRQVLAVLGQHAPAGVDVEDMATGRAAISGVDEVHDLHAWTLTSGHARGHGAPAAGAEQRRPPACCRMHGGCSAATTASNMRRCRLSRGRPRSATISHGDWRCCLSPRRVAVAPSRRGTE